MSTKATVGDEMGILWGLWNTEFHWMHPNLLYHSREQAAPHATSVLVPRPLGVSIGAYRALWDVLVKMYGANPSETCFCEKRLGLSIEHSTECESMRAALAVANAILAADSQT